MVGPMEKTMVDPRTDMVTAHLRASAAVKERTAETCAAAILAAADVVSATFRKGGKLLSCGNGGSAADCQHLAAEFTSRLSADFARPGLPAIALTTDTSFLTAYANDFDFDGVFARQVQALGKRGDALLWISTSGNSKNVSRAVETAKALGLSTFALTGSSGRLKDLVDLAICIPSDNPQHIQEAHLAVEHILCRLVERSIFGEGGTGDWGIPRSVT
jgi:D-sedoheptulose 7-phosphate isomerase